MNITDVKIRMLRDVQDRNLATAAITIDHSLVVHDILITEKAGGLTIVMPNRRCRDGQFRDIVHPICRNAREELTNALRLPYQKARREQIESRLLAERSHYLS